MALNEFSPNESIYEKLTNSDNLRKIIYQIPRNNFHQQIIKGVALSREFSSFGEDPEYTSEEDKAKLRNSLIAHGIPANCLNDSSDLLEAVNIITDRAVQLL